MTEELKHMPKTAITLIYHALHNCYIYHRNEKDMRKFIQKNNCYFWGTEIDIN